MCDINKRTNEEYTVVKLLGKGAFGSTYMVKVLGQTCEKMYVLKKLHATVDKLIESCQEINILKKIAKYGCKPELLCLKEYFINPNDLSINIVTEAFLDAITLAEFIKEKQKEGLILMEDELLKIMKGCMKALTYLHNIGIGHGDIKPENILINKNYEIQLIDFGFACSKNCRPSGTLLFASPEILRIIGSKQNMPLKSFQQADVFSMGMVFYLLANLEFPFHMIGINPYKNSDVKQTGILRFEKNSESSESSPRNSTVDSREYKLFPIRTNNEFSTLTSLIKFYENRINSIISMYQYNNTQTTTMINEFIESMLKGYSEDFNNRLSSQRLLKILQKIILRYTMKDVVLGARRKTEVSPIKDVEFTFSPTII
jgi:serine/threonine protein kinase